MTIAATVASIALIIAHPAQDRPSPLEKQVVKLSEHAVEFTMLKAPGGKVQVEGKEYDVKPFWIGQTEVPWEVYDVFYLGLDMTPEQRQLLGQKGERGDAQSRPSKPYGSPDRGFGHNGYAAIHMTHNAATEFAKWLGEKTGKKFRLATDAEWQLAANSGKATPQAFDANAEAWFWDNADDEAHAIATKKANAWGIYDLFGNAQEWVNDMEGKPVTRGGSFMSKLDKVGPTARAYQDAKWNQNDPQNPKSKWWLSNAPFVGIRLVMEP